MKEPVGDLRRQLLEMDMRAGTVTEQREGRMR